MVTRIAGPLLAGVLALTPASNMDSEARPAGMEPAIAVVSSDTLRDVAVAVYDSAHPVIYVNQVKLSQFEPVMQQFFMAHERGHITLHHTRAYALNGTIEGKRAAIVARELEADCWASQTLARTDRRAALGAARFFAQMGPFRYDREHPSGSQRAARILACLPEETAQH